jgi:hypothetical protein
MKFREIVKTWGAAAILTAGSLYAADKPKAQIILAAQTSTSPIQTFDEKADAFANCATRAAGIPNTPDTEFIVNRDLQTVAVSLPTSKEKMIANYSVKLSFHNLRKWLFRGVSYVGTFDIETGALTLSRIYTKRKPAKPSPPPAPKTMREIFHEDFTANYFGLTPADRLTMDLLLRCAHTANLPKVFKPSSGWPNNFGIAPPRDAPQP